MAIFDAGGCQASIGTYFDFTAGRARLHMTLKSIVTISSAKSLVSRFKVETPELAAVAA